MKKIFNNVPDWVVNAISLIAGAMSIITFLFAFFGVFAFKIDLNLIYYSLVCLLLFFLVIVSCKLRKYQDLNNVRMDVTSSSFYKAFKCSKNLYFDVMSGHKLKLFPHDQLTKKYEDGLVEILNKLCEVMDTFTGKEVNACIKLITYPADAKSNNLNVDNATLVTLCRSNIHATDRKNYESSKTEILLKDNTDFMQIIEPDVPYDYFYCKDLVKFKKKLNEVGQDLKNTNTAWEKDYKSTVIVPIRTESKRLYHLKTKDSSDEYDLLGFLCIDSKSTEAFTSKNEQYNVSLMSAYAEVCYILLSQYSHYLSKYSNDGT